MAGAARFLYIHSIALHPGAETEKRVPRKHKTTWNSWRAMHSRCSRPKDPSFKRYGARGISVCDRWSKFDNFLQDMGERPDGMTLDRIDSNGNYEPGNCRWATWVQQNRNRRHPVDHAGLGPIAFDGRVQSANAWVCEFGLGKNTLSRRLRAGWSIERALTTPGNGRRA